MVVGLRALCIIFGWKLRMSRVRLVFGAQVNKRTNFGIVGLLQQPEDRLYEIASYSSCIYMFLDNTKGHCVSRNATFRLPACANKILVLKVD